MADLRCDKCNLYKTSTAGVNYSAVKVDGKGNFESEIMIVGECLGATEVRLKEPFVSDDSKTLRRYLQSVGVNDKNAYFTYVCKCRPPDSRHPKKNEIKACLSYLEEEIKQMKPKVIGALGNTALRALGVEGKITGIHGSKVWSKKYNCWIVPLYHPSYVTRFTNEARQRREFVTDMGLLTQLIETEVKVSKTKYKVAKTLDEVKKATDYLLKQKLFSFDIETNHLNFMKADIICISFSAKPGTAVVIPYQDFRIFTKEQQEQVKKYLTTILSSDIHKAGQNGKFDIKHLLKHNIEVKKYFFDTMLAHHLLDESGTHNLEVLSQTYTSMANHKDAMKDYIHAKKNEYNKILEAPLKTLFEYAAKDADATIRVYLKLKELLKEEELEEVFYKIVMPLTYVLARMESKGMQVDKKYVSKAAASFKYKIKELEKDIQDNKMVKKYLEKYNKEEFNTRSPKQKIELLYDVMEIKPIKFNKPTKTKPEGSPSTDAETLKELYKITKAKIIKDLLDYSKLKKLQDYILSYKELANESEDGRIHTSYSQRRARTGRLSSSNPNLQNVPSVKKDPIRAAIVRNCLVATKGHTILDADYKQAEFRVWADNSGDEKLIAFCSDPTKDIHRQVASIVYHIPYDKITEGQRDIAKTVVFGLMYGRTSYSIAQQFGITEGEAERILRGFFKAFPRAAKWMEEQVEFAKQNGYIRNMFGRKRRLDNIYSVDKKKSSSAERQARNTPIQGGTADIVFKAMIKMYREFKKANLKANLILNVHDSIAVETPDEDIKEVAKIMKYSMETAVKLKVPLWVDIKMGKRFGEMKEYSSI